MGKKGKYTTQQFIEAIRGSAGIISTIADRVGCAWHTAKKYIETYPSIQEAYDDECQRVLDMAEAHLLKAIREGDSATIRWYLSHKGRHRGYGDAVHVQHGGDVGVTVISREEWLRQRSGGGDGGEAE